ncbi:MAG: hypothetical protein QOJ35_4150 [Solirubrobacteraceae bacterium]|nr:hypothetical protein [Solirubrobacteraceae bacterium]
MQLDPHLSRVHDQLVAAAALGDDRTREIAEALTTAAVPAMRLALLAAASEIADEITAALLDHPGSPAVAVRIDDDEVAVDVRAGATADGAAEVRHADGEASARISLRLTDALKADIDAAAERDGVSVNAWLVRAAGSALRPGAPDAAAGGRGHGRRSDTQHVTGWING